MFRCVSIANKGRASGLRPVRDRAGISTRTGSHHRGSFCFKPGEGVAGIPAAVGPLVPPPGCPPRLAVRKLRQRRCRARAGRAVRLPLLLRSMGSKGRVFRIPYGKLAGNKFDRHPFSNPRGCVSPPESRDADPR